MAGPSRPLPLRPASVDGQRPALVLGVLAPDGAEVDLLELLGELPDGPVADLAVVDLDHGGDLGAGAAEEQLVARVELRPVDAALNHCETELVPDHADQQVAGDPLQDVVGHRRGHEDAVLEYEEVLGGALRDVPVVSEHDRLVVAVLERLRLGKGRVDVGPRHLCSGRQRTVRDAAPAGDHAADPGFDLDVVAEGRGVDQEAVRQAVQLHADLLHRLEEKRPDVSVRPVPVALEQGHGDLDELLHRVRQLHAQDLGGFVKALVVGWCLEQVELLLPLVPVSANALEGPCPVMQGVGHDPEPDVVVPGELAIEEDPRVRVLRSSLRPRGEVGVDTHFARLYASGGRCLPSAINANGCQICTTSSPSCDARIRLSRPPRRWTWSWSSWARSGTTSALR